MRNIKLTIEYDGTNYHGWQSQLDGNTVQDYINKVLCELTGEKINVTGSSRTDTGVHAYGQVANFFTDSNIPEDKYTFAMNARLPEDIVVVRSEEVDMDFHARFSTKGKKYRYLIHNSTYPSALLRHRAYHVFYPLDVDAMSEAAQFFLGTHDFKAFMATGSIVKSTVRTINDIAVYETNLGKTSIQGSYRNHTMNKQSCMVTLDISGDGFLYNMVRIIAGTLVQVGYGKIRPWDIPGIIEAGDRRKAGKTAPAFGLYLLEVFY